jgi:hypothetical protein
MLFGLTAVTIELMVVLLTVTLAQVPVNGLLLASPLYDA